MNLQNFFFDNSKQIRTLLINGVVWFAAKDVTTALEYVSHTNAIKRHCKPKGVSIQHYITKNRGRQKMTFISQPNLFRLIARSNMPKAVLFEEWIFEVVLPAIFQTGKFEIEKKPKLILPSTKIVHPASIVLPNAEKWDKRIPDAWYMMFSDMRNWGWSPPSNKPSCMAYYTGYYLYDRVSPLLLSAMRKVNPKYINFHHQHLKQVGLSELFRIIHGQITLAEFLEWNWHEWNLAIEKQYPRQNHQLVIQFRPPHKQVQTFSLSY